MDKTPLKKIKMMDIVRKSPSTSSTMHHAPKEEQVKFTIEKKTTARQIQESIDERESRRERKEEKEMEKEDAPVYRVVESESEKEEHKPVEHAQPHILEMHTPEVSSMEIDRPIAYIPKEKPSKEERKVLERIERRERSSEQEARRPKRRKGIVVWIVSCILLGVLAYLAVAVLPRAEIIVTAKPTKSYPYAGAIGASTKIAEIDSANKQIPVAVFTEKKTNTFTFPATGAGKSIERKAVGKATIYNNFSTSQQPLVAGTRLETPDGKIFRLVDRVVVPGATSEGGSLTAGSIEVDVIADKAGEAYNISPVSKFTIPGFKGTTKYEGFYAESKGSMTGGFIGEGKYPTASDIKAGKESAEKEMQGLIDTFMATQVVPEDFKIVDSSKKYAILKEVVSEAVDEQGNFSIYIEAEGSVDALKEEHVLKLMTALAKQINGDEYELKSHTLSYGTMNVDEKTGAIALQIDFKGVYWRPIVVDEFKRDVMGKKEEELKNYIFSSISIEKADVAFWPFWVKTVPNDPDRVKVELK